MSEDLSQFLANHLPSVQDPVLVVLKGHLVLEWLLEQIIFEATKHPDYLHQAHLDFNQKLCIARSLSCNSDTIDESSWSTLESLNNLRKKLVKYIEFSKGEDYFNEFLNLKHNDNSFKKSEVVDLLRKEMIALFQVLIPLISNNRIQKPIFSYENLDKEAQSIVSEDEGELDDFFISYTHRLAFCLLEKDSNLEKKIGITRQHYVDKKLAKEWRDGMMKRFHPDISVSNDSSFNKRVSQQITLVYKRLIGEA